jgi:hypothetical protein
MQKKELATGITQTARGQFGLPMGQDFAPFLWVVPLLDEVASR